VELRLDVEVCNGVPHVQDINPRPVKAGQDLVFCRVNGAMPHPERFSWSFGARVRQLGLPIIRLHDLRHGWATLALAAGVRPKVVQERLGHANIRITLDTYSHVTQTLHDDAAEKVADIVCDEVR
jgi:integrase